LSHQSSGSCGCPAGAFAQWNSNPSFNTIQFVVGYHFPTRRREHRQPNVSAGRRRLVNNSFLNRER